MEVLHLSSNSRAFVFDDLKPLPTAVYLIEGVKHQFLIDTYCGAGYLDEIQKEITRCSKPLVVINTHHHWDHIWGNCMFADAPIIAHAQCRKDIETEWEHQYAENSYYCKGDTTKTLPNITFEKELVFEEDGIVLFHTPGHTLDSISIYDRNYKILYGGDNLELPCIYLNHNNLDQYIEVLKGYLAMDVLHYTGSHRLSLTREEVQSIIDYLNCLANDTPITIDNPFYRYVHEANVKLLHSFRK